MADIKHTPGPWSRNINAKYPVYAGPKGHHTHVASVLSGPEYVEGDLCLIAAAPDLLAALQDIVNANAAGIKIALTAMPPEKRERMIDDNETHTIRAFDKARAAIAKATGGQP